MDSTKKDLTRKCSDVYFYMYQLFVRLSLIEHEDGDDLADLFCLLDDMGLLDD